MFERPHHQRVAQVLASLDANLLARSHCLFGGGTAIALRYGEYRESVDIDFLVSDIDGYRHLRQLLTGNQGLGALARQGSEIQQSAELRADQYGIRSSVRVGDIEIKFEIVLEARIELELPGAEDRIGDIATLTPLDMATSKLLANSDRWADDSVFSRDIIDLAMMNPGRHCCVEQPSKPAAPTATASMPISPKLPRRCSRGRVAWTVAWPCCK